MTTRLFLIALPLLLACTACGVGSETEGGEVRIAIEQALTGETTSAGTFAMTGALRDEGQTTEVLTFGGPLTQSPVPITFRRTLTGSNGTIIIVGSATLTFTSAAAATIAGTWQVEASAGSTYRGSGALTGSANFGATPPTGALTYTGSLTR